MNKKNANISKAWCGFTLINEDSELLLSTFLRSLENHLETLLIYIKFIHSFSANLHILFDVVVASKTSLLCFIWFPFAFYFILLHFLFFIFYRHEKNGVQDTAMAWKMLLLLCMQKSHWNKIIYTERAGDLLRRLLWGEICDQMHQMQQSTMLLPTCRLS